MKKILLLSFLLISVAAFSQAPVEFKETKHSFGKLKQNVPATYIFTFTNTGTKPAIIETATAECGCTTPEYPKAPIAKGKTATIKVTYNAATPGQFTKKVNVKFANAQDVVVLTIDGEVVPATK